MEFDQYPNLSEGADRVDGQLREDKECPFSGITRSGRVWKKVPESDAGSVGGGGGGGGGGSVCLLLFFPSYSSVPAVHLIMTLYITVVRTREGVCVRQARE